MPSFRCIGSSLKDWCSPDSFSAVQTPVSCLQPWSLPRGNGWGLGLELFKALGLYLQCPWWNHFKFYNCSNLKACSQVLFLCRFWISCLHIWKKHREEKRRHKPSVRGKEISRAKISRAKNITFDEIKRKISGRQTTTQMTARKTWMKQKLI